MARNPIDETMEVTRTVIRNAIAEGGVVRLHVPDPLGDSGRMRIIEGEARELSVGKDGRERVVVAVGTATDPVEIRLLLDRIERVERLLSTNAEVTTARSVTQPQVRPQRITQGDTPADGATRKYPAVRESLAAILAGPEPPKRRG